MNVQARLQEDRRKTNPLFNDRKLKLGTFGTNLDHGCAISTIDGALRDQLAEHAGARPAAPRRWSSRRWCRSARWRGFGGNTNFNGPGFETLLVGARRSARRPTTPAIFATSHVPTIHPIMAAKQAHHHRPHHRRPLRAQHRHRLEPAGDRDVRRRRCCEHDDRYDCAVEWLDIIKRLWTEDEEFDFEGKFYKIKKGYPAAEADPAAVIRRS